MVICRNCGESVNESANFCPKCGRPMNTEQYGNPQPKEKNVFEENF